MNGVVPAEVPVDVLIADDDPNDVMLTERGLRGHDPRLRIHHVRDGVEALEALIGPGSEAGSKRRPPPRLVLLDIKMPRIGGVEVLQRLRNAEGLADLPIVMLTSSESPRDRAQCEAAGATDYFVKPLEFQAYLTAMEQIARRWLGDP